MSRIMSIVALFIIMILQCGCATNPVTGEDQLMLISPAQELQIGRQYAPEVQKQLDGPIPNTTLQNYVNSVGQRIAQVSHMPDKTFTYIAVNHDTVNALALPGGYVFVTRGMLKQLETEAQLAAVLAHETVHVTARHSAESMSQQIGMDLVLSAVSESGSDVASVAQIGTQMISLSHSRSQEYQADMYGLDYLVAAGYDPQAMIQMMQILERQNNVRPFEYFSTHPSPENRLANIQNRIAEKQYNSPGRIAKEDYQNIVLNNL